MRRKVKTSAEERAALAVWRRLRDDPGIIAIAIGLGLTRQAVQQWRMVPLQHIAAVEKLTGVSRRELRPDIAALWCAAAE